VKKIFIGIVLCLLLIPSISLGADAKASADATVVPSHGGGDLIIGLQGGIVNKNYDFDSFQPYDANTLKKAAAALTDGQRTCSDASGDLVSCGANTTYTEPAGVQTLCRTGAGTIGACTNPIKLAVFSWDGGVSAVATASSKRCTIFPQAATIVGVYAIADASTTTHLHVYQDAFAAGARSTTVTGAVDIGATLGSVDTTLAGWDKSITAADEICMSVESNNNAKWLTVIVYGTY